MSRRVATVAALATAAMAGLTQAAPVRTSPPPSPLASGVRAHWADVTTSPHTTADALNALAGAGGFTVARTRDTILAEIDVGDCCDAAILDPFSALGDDNFAVRYSGYLRIAERGSYQFAMYHDDRVRVVIGGEEVISLPTDTSPTTTTSGLYDLEAGYYSLSIIGWEQGGQFVNRFGFMGSNGLVVADDLWHVATRVSEPQTLALLGMSVLGLALYRKRKN